MNHTGRDPLLRAALELKERNLPPARDLWPDIDAAIDRLEGEGRRQAGRGPSLQSWFHLAAAAAVFASPCDNPSWKRAAIS